MFEILLANIASLRHQTELLEACNWNEEEAHGLIALARDAIQDLDNDRLPTQQELEACLAAKLNDVATSSQIVIVKHMVFAEFKKAVDDFSKAENAIEN